MSMKPARRKLGVSVQILTRAQALSFTCSNDRAFRQGHFFGFAFFTADDQGKS